MSKAENSRGESEEYSTDESGSKRRACHMTDFFDKSKKTPRTPQKRQKMEESKLDEILKMVSEISTNQKDMRKEQADIKKEIQRISNDQKAFNQELLKLKVENDELKKENQQIKVENERIKHEMQDVKQMLEAAEKERRRNNILMFGLCINEDDQAVARENVRGLLSKYLEIDVKPKRVTTIGNTTSIIELENSEDKKMVMIHKSKLRNIPGQRIFINNDMTKGEREKQKQIRLFAKCERQKGKEVKIGYNKVTVDGREWLWNKQKSSMTVPTTPASKN